MSDLTALQLSPALVAAIARHACQVFPHECCGLIARGSDGDLRYVPGQNMQASTAGEEYFELDPECWVSIEDAGDEVAAVVHSHPNEDANPSQADRDGCDRTQLPWVVMSWPGGALSVLEPRG